MQANGGRANQDRGEVEQLRHQLEQERANMQDQYAQMQQQYLQEKAGNEGIATKMKKLYSKLMNQVDDK